MTLSTDEMRNKSLIWLGRKITPANHGPIDGSTQRVDIPDRNLATITHHQETALLLRRHSLKEHPPTHSAKSHHPGQELTSVEDI